MHALKGAAMMAGAIRLRDSAARAESIAGSNFDSVSPGLVEDLRGTLEATNHELHGWSLELPERPFQYRSG